MYQNQIFLPVVQKKKLAVGAGSAITSPPYESIPFPEFLLCHGVVTKWNMLPLFYDLSSWIWLCSPKQLTCWSHVRLSTTTPVHKIMFIFKHVLLGANPVVSLEILALNITPLFFFACTSLARSACGRPLTVWWLQNFPQGSTRIWPRLQRPPSDSWREEKCLFYGPFNFPAFYF